MILFFNHVFKKRINEEPSPLEVEMFNYQKDIDHYVIIHENKESMKQKLMTIKIILVLSFLVLQVDLQLVLVSLLFLQYLGIFQG